MKLVYWILSGFSVMLLLFFLLAPTTEEAAKDAVKVNELDTSALKEEEVDLSTKPALYIGDPNAPATLVEYADFKCPSCNAFHRGTGKQLRDEYVNDGRLKIEFRNFPFIGPDSGRAARGTYCANDQGKFAEYHDRVYDYMWDNYYSSGDLSSEFTDELTIDVLVGIMDGVVADTAKFNECMESTIHNARVDTDVRLARGVSVSGTPSFTVGGQKVTGPSNFNTFKTLVDIQLQ